MSTRRGVREKVFTYVRGFRVVNGVESFYQARRFLLEDDMIEYLNCDSGLLGKLVCVDWVLVSPFKGVVKVKAREALSDSELGVLDGFIVEQTVDGLGEGFAGQVWAGDGFLVLDDEGLCLVSS